MLANGNHYEAEPICRMIIWKQRALTTRVKGRIAGKAPQTARSKVDAVNQLILAELY